jgi:NADH-quinone oxidoreductase subunit N
MRSLVLLPEALVVAGAIGCLFAGRIGRIRRRQRIYLPAAAVVIALVAFGVELWAGATVGSFFGGALVQDRFALFAKAAVLLTVAVAIAVADWSAEDSAAIGVAMALLAAFGVMVAASAGDLAGLWAGLELAAAAAVVLVALRRPELGLRLLITGGLATALLLAGFAFVYATAGRPDLSGLRASFQYAAPTLPLVFPVLLMLGGLAVRAGLPMNAGASPLGAGLLLGLVAAAGLVAGIKVAAFLSPLPQVFSPYLSVVAAVAMLGGGAASLVVRSPRARVGYLALGQVGWVAAGLSTHYRAGLGASLFLLGAFAVAACAAPVVMGAGAVTGEMALAGMGALRPARAAGLAASVLSLAGAPPLGGFFGEFAVAASLAQSHHFVLLALGLAGSVMGLAAAFGMLRVIYVQSPLEEGRRAAGSALPPFTRFSTAGAVLLGAVIMAYGLFGNPILGLADQGAEALGLR